MQDENKRYDAQITFPLPSQDKTNLQTLADARGTTVAQLMREMVIVYLGENLEALDRAKETVQRRAATR